MSIRSILTSIYVAFLMYVWLHPVASAQTPVIAPNGIVNGASFGAPGATGQGLAPGSIVSIFGHDLASAAAQARGAPLPAMLGDASVTFNGVAAPLFYVSPTQINAQLPWSLLPPSSTSGVATAVVTRAGIRSNGVTIQLSRISPALFTFASGTGPAVAINLDGTIAQPQGSFFNVKSRAPSAGDIVILYATGLGPLDFPVADGLNSLDLLRTVTTTPVVQIAGKPAPVLFAGLSPQFVGVNQLNVVVPQGTTAGDRVPVQLQVGNAISSANVTMAVADPDLQFLAPHQGDIIAGDYALAWVSDNRPAEMRPTTGMVFETSQDGRTFTPVPQQLSPDHGPGNFTNALDTTLLAPGRILVRARYQDSLQGPIIQATVRRLPQPMCTVSPGSIQELIFDCSASVDETGRIVAYRWDFGDGTNVTTDSPVISHRYVNAGVHPFQVTVVNDANLTGTALRDLVFDQLGNPALVARKTCGCQEMILSTTGMSTLRDSRRPNPGGVPPLNPAPLGLDPMFISYNFEVTGILVPDSDPAFCTEGQGARRTATTGANPPTFKMACTNRDLAFCRTNEDCDTHRCVGGFQDGKPADEAAAVTACAIGGGTRVSNFDGACRAFAYTPGMPVLVQPRGNDDYHRDYTTDSGPKLHCPSCGSPTWFDAPGATTLPRATTGFNVRYDADFFSFVNGPAGRCACHFTITLDWNGTTHLFGAATGFNLVHDGETENCTVK